MTGEILIKNLWQVVTGFLVYNEDRPMLFTSLYFWIFLALVFLAYSAFYRKRTLRSVYLLLVSIFFYYKSGGFFFVLLLISVFTDYFTGLLVYHSRKRLLRKFWVTVSLVVNLGLLGYFKYAYFFTDILQQVSGQEIPVINYFGKWLNDLLGTRLDIGTIALPVGISFYTFQSISYTVDIYRNKLKPVNSFFDFAFYVSFFPQLVAGPIVRAAHFIPQIYQKYRLSIESAGHAMFLIMSGLLKKLFFSDTLATQLVDGIFQDPAGYTGFENLLAMYGYALQIYFDFSGYTDIAIGVALLFGFRLPINFNQPYKALNPTDFWHRWHISLSTWLRDYLYIPLGGNRKGHLRTYLHIFITMLLGGLWHGANIKFIFWGVLHGLALIIHKLTLKLIPWGSSQNKFIKSVKLILTFHFVSLLWLVFRAEDWPSTVIMAKQIFLDFGLNYVPQVLASYWKILLLMLGGFFLVWLPSVVKEKLRGWYISLPLIVKVLGFVVLFYLVYQVISADLIPFIYFRF